MAQVQLKTQVRLYPPSGPQLTLLKSPAAKASVEAPFLRWAPLRFLGGVFGVLASGLTTPDHGCPWNPAQDLPEIPVLDPAIATPADVMVTRILIQYEMKNVERARGALLAEKKFSSAQSFNGYIAQLRERWGDLPALSEPTTEELEALLSQYRQEALRLKGNEGEVPGWISYVIGQLEQKVGAMSAPAENILGHSITVNSTNATPSATPLSTDSSNTDPETAAADSEELYRLAEYYLQGVRTIGGIQILRGPDIDLDPSSHRHGRDLIVVASANNGIDLAVREILGNVQSDNVSVYLAQIDNDAKIVIILQAESPVTIETEQLLRRFADQSHHSVTLYSADAPYRREYVTRSPMADFNGLRVGYKVVYTRADAAWLATQMEPGVPLALVSIPRVGKTSVAEGIQLQLSANDATIPSFVDMRNMRSYPNLTSFLKWEVDRIAYGIQKRRGMATSAISSDHTLPLKAMDVWLGSQGLKVAIVFDEAAKFGSYRDLAPGLQDLKNIYSIVVLHKSPHVDADLGAIFPDGKAKIYTVGLMSQEESAAYLQAFYSQHPEHAPIDAVQAHAMSGGHIPTLKSLASGSVPSIEWLAKVMIRIGDFTDEERGILVKAAKGYPLRPEDCDAKALALLQSLGLLRTDAIGQLHISGTLIRDAILQSLGDSVIANPEEVKQSR